MSNAPTIKWNGKSGTQYEYYIYPIGTSFKEIPGNYIFAKKNNSGYWSPCYIGQTENLNNFLLTTIQVVGKWQCSIFLLSITADY